jgi:hypothetical protein
VKFLPTILSLLALVSTMGATFTDSFSEPPLAWKTHNPGAVQWDESAGNLSITWDSRETNSFFYFPLGTTLTRQDSFKFEFTIRLDNVQVGINPLKQSTFPLCLGFLNLEQAKRPEYFRGAGVRPANGPRSVVEFGYFPGTEFEPTIGPIIASTNNQIAYSHSHPVELVPGETYRVHVAFDSATQILSTTIEHNGSPYGEPTNNSIRPLYYTEQFADFRADVFSIHSYSDAGQIPEQYAGSLLAHGVIDDIIITWPDPPIIQINGRWDGPQWLVVIEPQPTWFYSLERSIDLKAWESIASGAGSELRDTAPPASGAFYRVYATRP